MPRTISKALSLIGSIFLFLLGLNTLVRGQPVDISGTVVDSATASPIAGAFVRIVETPWLSTTTAANGTFTLAGSATLVPAARRHTRPETEIRVSGNGIVISSVSGRQTALVDVYDAVGHRVRHESVQINGNGTIRISNLLQKDGFYFVSVNIGGRRYIANRSMRDLVSRTAWATPEAHPGLSKTAAAATLEVMSPGYIGKQIVLASDAGSAGIVKLFKHTGPYYWSQTTSGAKKGLTRYGYCGAWDQNPAAVPGQFLWTQVNNDPTLGYPSNDIPFGVLGQTSPISTLYRWKVGGSWKTASYQDTKNFDFHIACNGGQVASNGVDPTPYSFSYGRFRPIRDNTGRITDMSKETEYMLSTVAGGATNGWVGANFNISEVVDGTGAKRMLLIIQRERQLPPTASNTNIVVDCYLGLSTTASGTMPGIDDWVGLDNISKDPTYVGTLKNLPNQDAYFTDSYVAQHPLSHVVELFQSQAAHGIPAEHDWISLTPIAGTGAWTVRDAVAGVAAPPASSGHYLTSYNSNAGWGCLAVQGVNDDIWWIWDDGIVTRISCVKKDGTVDWNPLPTLGERLSWNSMKSLAVAPDGAIGIIDISVVDNSPIRGRICRNSVWTPWLDMGIVHNPNYLSDPLQGLTRFNGEYWFGLVSVPMNGTQESTIAAFSFSAIP